MPRSGVTNALTLVRSVPRFADGAIQSSALPVTSILPPFALVKSYSSSWPVTSMPYLSARNFEIRARVEPVSARQGLEKSILYSLFRGLYSQPMSHWISGLGLVALEYSLVTLALPDPDISFGPSSST